MVSLTEAKVKLNKQSMASIIEDLQATNPYVHKAFSLQQQFGHTYEQTLEMLVIALVEHSDALQALVVRKAQLSTQVYSCGKPIPEGKGNTNANSGCGEFNCGPCNEFFHGD